MTNEPNAWKLEQAMSMLQSLRHDETIATDESELAAAIEAGTETVMELLARVVRGALEAKSFADAIAARIDDLQARKARYVARDQRLRGVAFAIMDVLGESKIALPDFTASIGKPREGLVITDETQIPDEYMRVERSPDKGKISEALKNGVVITGAMVANGMPTFTIRSK